MYRIIKNYFTPNDPLPPSSLKKNKRNERTLPVSGKCCIFTTQNTFHLERNMHILEIPSFFPPYGGLFCLDQAKALHSLGHEVRILSNVQLGVTKGLRHYFTLPTGRFEQQMDGITVWQSYQRGIPRMVRYNMERWVGIVGSMFEQYIKRYGRPDVLHTHCAKWAGYAAMLISRQHGIPYIITEHLPLMILEEEFGKAPTNAWQVPLLREAYQEAGMVLPVSEELVRDTACYYGNDYRWQYVSNTIDTNFFHYQSRKPRAGRAFRFCCLADYQYRKGYDVLFLAFQKLQDRNADVELHIAGQQTDSTACSQEIERLHLKHVKAYGRLDKHHVRDLLYQCDALILASRSEVQPLVLLEAMSTGIPVVCTECVPQCLRVEKGCLVVPVGDDVALAAAMEKTMTTSADGHWLSEQAANLASPQVVGQKIEAILHTLLHTA